MYAQYRRRPANGALFNSRQLIQEPPRGRRPLSIGPPCSIDDPTVGALEIAEVPFLLGASPASSHDGGALTRRGRSRHQLLKRLAATVRALWHRGRQDQ